jgi:DNA-binding transcriptional ArsR family regulator
METKAAISALQSLAQETRLAVFRLLVTAGPHGMPAGDIATALEVPSPTLSFHLNHLAHAGLVQRRRAGRSVIYSVRYDDVRELLEFLTEDCCQGRAELCRPFSAKLRGAACSGAGAEAGAPASAEEGDPE